MSHLESRPKDGSFDLEAYEQGLVLKPNHGKTEARKRADDNMSGDWSDCSDSDKSDASDEQMDSDSSSEEEEKEDSGKHKKKNK